MDKMLRNPGFQHIAEDIFMNWDLKDLVNCQLVSKYFNQILENSFFGSKDGSGKDYQRKPRKIGLDHCHWVDKPHKVDQGCHSELQKYTSKTPIY